MAASSDLIRVMPSSSPSTSDASLPAPMNPVQQRRRAALLAESPEPPPQPASASPGSVRAGFGSAGTISGGAGNGQGNVDSVELFIEAASVGEESGLGCCTR